MDEITNATDPADFEPDLSKLGTADVVITLCLSSIVINSLLIYCFVAKRNEPWAKKGKQLFYLILSDLIVSLLMIPRLIFEFTLSLKTYTSCAVSTYTVIATQLVSYGHVLSLCVHRYMLIRNAPSPAQADRKHNGIHSLAIWVTALLVSLPPFIFSGQHDEILIDCRLWYIFGPTDRDATIYILVSFCVPWILTNLLYAAMIVKLQGPREVRPEQGRSRLLSCGFIDTTVEQNNLTHQATSLDNQITVTADQIAMTTFKTEVVKNHSKTTLTKPVSNQSIASALVNQAIANQPTAITTKDNVTANPLTATATDQTSTKQTSPTSADQASESQPTATATDEASTNVPTAQVNNQAYLSQPTAMYSYRSSLCKPTNRHNYRPSLCKPNVRYS